MAAEDVVEDVCSILIHFYLGTKVRFCLNCTVVETRTKSILLVKNQLTVSNFVFDSQIVEMVMKENLFPMEMTISRRMSS